MAGFEPATGCADETHLVATVRSGMQTCRELLAQVFWHGPKSVRRASKVPPWWKKYPVPSLLHVSILLVAREW